MSTLTPLSDLYEYFAILWRGRDVILLGTAGCMVVMAALTWAMPRLYVVRSEIDAGMLAQAQPVETNLLVEAVDRSHFTVSGGLFPESMPKGLTVSWRPPSTMILEAKGTDPADMLRRLQVLTAGVDAELQARFRRYARSRADTQERADTANARLLHLKQLMDERSIAAVSSAAEARADARKAASERESYQRTAEARYRQPLREVRDRLRKKPDADPALIASVRVTLDALAPDDDAAEPENLFFALETQDVREGALKRLSALSEPVLAELPPVLRQISAYDFRVARALELQRDAELQPTTAELLRKRDARGLSLLNDSSPVVDAATAGSLEKSLGELEETYQDDPSMARAVGQARVMFVDLVKVYSDEDRMNGLPSLARPPKVLVAPAMPPSPAWPRPAVNLAIAFLFGLVGSVILAVFRSSVRPRAL